jgi:hypothetical protein
MVDIYLRKMPDLLTFLMLSRLELNFTAYGYYEAL